MAKKQQCGYIGIIGRPNVGKSTLLNKMLGQKISITSRKPQTTRHQILGIKTTDHCQMIFVDTPGLHKAQGKTLNKIMNKNALSTMNSVDVVLFLIEALQWREEDQWILDKLATVEAPIVLVINKIDNVKEKKALLPFIDEIKDKFDFAAIVLVCAKLGDHVPDLQAQLKSFLPEREPVFPEDEITDRSMKFIAAEIIREKIIRLTAKELPYSTAVEIEKYEQKKKITHISAVILVDKAGQKPILLGQGGTKMKEIGQQARKDLEKILGSKVFLQLWVKVKGGWSDDERALQSLGYTD